MLGRNACHCGKGCLRGKAKDRQGVSKAFIKEVDCNGFESGKYGGVQATGV